MTIHYKISKTFSRICFSHWCLCIDLHFLLCELTEEESILNCMVFLFSLGLKHCRALLSTLKIGKHPFVRNMDLCITKQDVPSQWHPVSPLLLLVAGNPRTGNTPHLDWLPLLCCVPDSTDREFHYPICDPGWEQSTPAYVLLPGHVGYHWLGSLHSYHP